MTNQLIPYFCFTAVINVANKDPYIIQLLDNYKLTLLHQLHLQLEVWANAQSDGRPAEYRWRPLFNAPNFG